MNVFFWAGKEEAGIFTGGNWIGNICKDISSLILQGSVTLQ